MATSGEENTGVTDVSYFSWLFVSSGRSNAGHHGFAVRHLPPEASPQPLQPSCVKWRGVYVRSKSLSLGV